MTTRDVVAVCYPAFPVPVAAVDRVVVDATSNGSRLRAWKRIRMDDAYMVVGDGAVAAAAYQGAAYLEMARQALAVAIGDRREGAVLDACAVRYARFVTMRGPGDDIVMDALIGSLDGPEPIELEATFICADGQFVGRVACAFDWGSLDA